MSGSGQGAEFKESDQFEKELFRASNSAFPVPSRHSSKIFTRDTNPYHCWWNSDSAIPASSGTNIRSTANNLKYFGISSTEFQSLKLESVSSTMEELKLVSASFSALLEKEQQAISKRYKEGATSASKDHADSKSVQSSDDETAPEHFLSQQTTVFDQMREFLLAQQMCLRQNLEMLHTKTTIPRKETTNYNSNGKLQEVISHEDLNQNEDLEGLRQWGSSSSGRANEIQICPVCGMEFEVNENPDALEEHVASHWCSSEPL